MIHVETSLSAGPAWFDSHTLNLYNSNCTCAGMHYYIIAINLDYIEVFSPTITSHSYL